MPTISPTDIASYAIANTLAGPAVARAFLVQGSLGAGGPLIAAKLIADQVAALQAELAAAGRAAAAAAAVPPPPPPVPADPAVAAREAAHLEDIKRLTAQLHTREREVRMQVRKADGFQAKLREATTRHQQAERALKMLQKKYAALEAKAAAGRVAPAPTATKK